MRTAYPRAIRDPKDYVSIVETSRGVFRVEATRVYVGNGIIAIPSREYLDALVARHASKLRLVRQSSNRYGGVGNLGSVTHTYSNVGVLFKHSY